jgi:Flp pilus assembly protein TadG
MNRLRRERGAALVEFSILFLLLMTLLFGLIEFGFLWLESYYIGNAAREGARAAAKINGTTEEKIDAAELAAKEYLRNFPFFEEHLDDAGFLDVDVDPTMTLTVPDVDPPPAIIEVQLTVQTGDIWEPISGNLLGALLKLITLGNTDFPEDFGKEITRTATFVTQN